MYGKLQETFVNDNFMNTFHFESYPDFTFDYIKKKTLKKEEDNNSYDATRQLYYHRHYL